MPSAETVLLGICGWLTSAWNCLISVWNWLTVVGFDRGQEYDSALVAVTGLSGLIWTGGFVLRSIYHEFDPTKMPLFVTAMFVLDLLQTAFMIATLALFAVPHGVRIPAIFYFVVYGRIDIPIYREVLRIRSGTVPGVVQGPHNPRTRFKRNIANVIAASPGHMTLYIFTRAALYLGVLALFIWPTSLTAAIITWCWTFIGMQAGLAFLYGEIFA